MLILEPWRPTRNASFHRAVFKKEVGAGRGCLVCAGQQLLITTETAGPLLSHRWGVTCGGWAPPPTPRWAAFSSASGVGMRKCVEHTEANSNRLSSEKILGGVSRGGAGENRAGEGWPSPELRLTSDGAVIAPARLFISFLQPVCLSDPLSLLQDPTCHSYHRLSVSQGGWFQDTPPPPTVGTKSTDPHVPHVK